MTTKIRETETREETKKGKGKREPQEICWRVCAPYILLGFHDYVINHPLVVSSSPFMNFCNSRCIVPCAVRAAKKSNSLATQLIFKYQSKPAVFTLFYALHTIMADISSLINPPDEVDQKPVLAEIPVAKSKKSAELPKPEDDEKVSQDSILLSFDKIKTHFPAARIKKIMQSDEDIGKVAQATPVVVGRALEIFMANLVEAGIIEARKAGVRRISALHIRTAVENTEQFDFLVDVMSKYLSAKN